MRFARALAGMLLLVIGVVALAAGGGLWVVARHADPDGGFRARFEPVRTAGHAVVVTDLAGLLRRDAPFVRAGANRLRLTARTADGPAFLGLAPTTEVRRWLGDTPYATVDRIAVARGALPVRVDPVDHAEPVVPAPGPVGRPFWVRQGVGFLEWDPAEFGGRSLSLVLMRPDGRADLALDVRAELRAGWLTPARWALPLAGALLVAVALLVLLRPPRPREVVFVVEPDQVPVLAQRLGVISLSALGGSTRATGDAVDPSAARPLVAVGAVAADRPAIGPVPADRPVPVDRPVPADRPVPVGRPATLADLPAWPPLRTDHAGPVPTGGRTAPGTPADRAVAEAADPDSA